MTRILARIHEPSGHPWTLEELVKEACLSRAGFDRNFCALVGELPHQYLTRWRMGLGAQLLAETELRLGEIGLRVGYKTEFSFSRTFKLVRGRGVSPSQYRCVPRCYAIGRRGQRLADAAVEVADGIAILRRIRRARPVQGDGAGRLAQVDQSIRVPSVVGLWLRPMVQRMQPPQRLRPSRYTISPPTMVCSTLILAMSSAGTWKKLRSSTIISASLPTSSEPVWPSWRSV